MFFEASLGLAFRRRAEVVRVPAPTRLGRVLHVLTLGQASEAWERETFALSDMIRSLAAALADAGLSDLISAATDDEIAYRDDSRRDGDLDHVLRSIAERSEDALCLELVAMHRDEIGTYVVQISAERVHPVDRLPLRIRVYALLGAFDVHTLSSEGYRGTPGRVVDRLEQKLAAMIGSAGGVGSVVGALEARVGELVRRIEHSVRARLRTYPTEAVLLCCAIRPRARVEWEQPHAPIEAHAVPLFRPYAGLREAAFYTQLWLGVLSRVGGHVRRTLILDEGGRPVMHIGHEPANLAESRAFIPGESIADPPGALDVAYYAGNDYEAELRATGRLPPSDGKSGIAMWDEIRERELGVVHKRRHTLGAMFEDPPVDRFPVIGQRGGPGPWEPTSSY